MKEELKLMNDAHKMHDLAVQAYIYAYPMIVMEFTRRASTNVEAPTRKSAPMNQMVHLRTFPDHTFNKVVHPNTDTLYSVAWFNVLQEPIVLSISDTVDRYFMLSLLDMWTEVFAAPGSRTSGGQAANFAITGPHWEGTLPEGLEPIRCPTSMGWILGRTQTNGREDYDNVHRIQDGYHLTLLSQWGKSNTSPVKVPVNSTWDMKTPPTVQIAHMNAQTYFELFTQLLKDNPPHELDWNMVKQLQQIGITPGQDFEFSQISADNQQILEAAVGDAKQMISEKQLSETVNGWSIAREFVGTYGTAYLQRAYVAWVGLGANVPEDTIYPMSFVDGHGEPYSGKNCYVLHFDSSQLPPVNGFWSLAMYNSHGFFIGNPIHRYSISDRDKLQFNNDGSLDIYIQKDSPGKGKESNWLPAPANDFNLLMRLYWPKTDILTGLWNPPPVMRI